MNVHTQPTTEYILNSFQKWSLPWLFFCHINLKLGYVHVQLVYMTGEYLTMFLKSNNLNKFTKLYTAETFKGLPHPWASPSKSRLWNCTIQIFLGSEKKVISFSMKNKCTYEKIALCVWLCTVYTLHVIQYIWRSLQNNMKKKAFSANICLY